MIRLLLASFVAALALFGFGAAFWTCPIPYAYVEQASSDSETLGVELRKHLPNDGLYLVPGISNNRDEMTRLHRQGPIATIHYRKDGAEPMSPATLGAGFLHGWITTFLLGAMLRLAALPRYGQRLLLVMLSGLAAAIYLRLGDGLYWFQPWPWLILVAAYDTVAFLVAGLVLAGMVKPSPLKAAGPVVP